MNATQLETGHKLDKQDIRLPEMKRGYKVQKVQ
jgi:hypothetical protein